MTRGRTRASARSWVTTGARVRFDGMIWEVGPERNTEAAAAYRSALGLVSNRVEQNFLARRLSETKVPVET